MVDTRCYTLREMVERLNALFAEHPDAPTNTYEFKGVDIDYYDGTGEVTFS